MLIDGCVDDTVRLRLDADVAREDADRRTWHGLLESPGGVAQNLRTSPCEHHDVSAAGEPHRTRIPDPRAATDYQRGHVGRAAAQALIRNSRSRMSTLTVRSSATASAR